jgi:Spy/CpxP family protein refolding chaperone
MGQIMTQQSKLRDLYAMDRPDPKQVGDTYGAIAKLRQDMVVAQVKAHNDAMAVLSDDQRAQLKGLQQGEILPSAPATGQGQAPPQGQTQIPPPPASH